ncbi:MAG: hypothetical protein COZ06_24855 [Armatimonadetes bacterium CG_4_10_14_3_um_filter_66_18]|nr:addiction module toxin, HicA family [Armatimonadota bacterium]OIO93606.1 MAG: hypothetical protein AUJ96_29915 [Armatimonadetes bacterium CG2_30_66_41]PIU92196.1 MAG: hypothetical protein COS65_19195 [Armatimonadetes bacterium CG06_land_8_20_14_3_00_66_21]PIX46438.1 MAG: hypothetical protein COZ57_12020 [Armatimonadetes bacterium CG_4_8_14_3_um_filter_66_20]PIY42625.1 MAG: hypothetical protein COZ06_24855 [Armatimonadetes bacterium CG_4_10_14_3_um_filter_66_18]PJB67421.1 MAG: hypothetical p
MPEVPPCSRRLLIRKLRRLGFEGPFVGGKHAYMLRGHFRLTLPNPHGTELDREFVRELLKQAGISLEEWLAV